MLKSLEELVNIIRDRKNSNPEKSYTSKLLSNKKMNVEKVNEEVKELIEAIQKNDNQVHEAADVLYHLFSSLWLDFFTVTWPATLKVKSSIIA